MTTPAKDEHHHKHDTAHLEVEREPFLAFIPAVTRWAGGIVASELGTVAQAVVGFPSWSSGYMKETVEFYRENPRTLFDEVRVVIHSNESA